MSCSANPTSESKVTYISIYYVKSAEGTCSSGQYIAAVSDLQGVQNVHVHLFRFTVKMFKLNHYQPKT